MINLHVGDSYALLEPYVPQEIEKLLTYWHKSIVRDERTFANVVKGSVRKLYTLAASPDGSMQLVTLPGFVSLIKARLMANGYMFSVIDERARRPEPEMLAAMAGLRDYQEEGVYTLVQSRGGIMACPTGWGKCSHPSTPMIYANGTVKTMGEVKVGDLLMGDDSTPRTVLERIDGTGPMYRLTPGYGDPVELADHHILSLVKSGDCKRDKYPDGHIVDITVTDYLKQSATFKHRHKAYKVPVDFPAKAVTVDPYFMGMWLGNGTWYGMEITTPFQEVADYLQALADSLGLRRPERAVKQTEHCMRFAISGDGSIGGNTLMAAMRGYGLTLEKKKFIPRDFMINSREVRLQLLAGMLDSDGYYDPNGKFDWCSVDKELARDFVFLARSLGFRATEDSGDVEGFGKTVTRYRVFLSGDLHLIPTKVIKKQASGRKGDKDVLRCGFTLERIADGAYVGVRLDGNMRHLLGDFTVTHNTHCMAALCRAWPQRLMQQWNRPLTVVVAPTLDIVNKDYNDFKTMLPDREIGLLHGNTKKYSDDIQFVTTDSMANVPLEEAGLLIYDEVHTLTQDRAEQAGRAVNALKYGFSATPTGRFDGSDLLTFGVFGPVVYSRTYQEAIEDGAVVPIQVMWMKLEKPARWPDNGYHQRNAYYRHGVWRCAEMHRSAAAVAARIPQEMQALVIVDKLEHMNNLMTYLKELNYVPVHAETSQRKLDESGFANVQAISPKTRQDLYRRIAKGEIRKVISTGVYRQGVNFKELTVVINGEGMGSAIMAGQIPGRASRNIDGKSCAFIVDFWHAWDIIADGRGRLVPGSLLRDDKSREKVYTSLGFDQIWLDSPEQVNFS